ncbi:nucleotidyltransferase domain-containing protein [Geomonas paludis]|uniref:Nucleotidyltransferase n=1 Tax=Geomonas paludis TaxID=2740185 RepID=A0A6V8MQA4_9BACT|nr:nucleotidyltransferase domain-containing protein [Geomonas paludis]UPU36155.1 nucleotidyltransferase domain-containing protein [Geomonas paludis]GFO62235.1 nucleotidyltransferase [Geomonas paludis]
MLTSVDIDNLCETIVQGVHPQRIFLFGSYAEGRQTEDSDIDLVVVMNSDLDPHKRNVTLKRLFPRRKFSLDAFVFTPEEFERYKDVPGTIVYTAAHEGRLLYG